MKLFYCRVRGPFDADIVIWKYRARTHQEAHSAAAEKFGRSNVYAINQAV